MSKSSVTEIPERQDLATRPLTRRQVLRGFAGIASLGTIPSLLVACGNVGRPGSSVEPEAASSANATEIPTSTPESPGRVTTASTGRLTLASYQPMSNIDSAFTRRTGITIKVNTVFANDFGDGLDAYLSATPEDMITAGSGFMMRAVAARGLLTAIDDVWAKVGSSFPQAFQVAVSGDDGHRYCLPAFQYPWAVFYRKSLFADKGYSAPTTWSEYKALAARMQRDGLIPIAMGNKELFPAMGTFDILDMRLNGYQFHVDLLAGRERWTDARVRRVFERWMELLPFTQPGANGRTWEEAAEALATKRAGMFYFGLFLTQAVQGVAGALDDLDLFPFPTMGTPFDAEKAIDAPIEGFMITRKSPTLAVDLDNAKAFMEFLADGSTQTALAEEWSVIAPSNDASTDGYSPLQHAASDLMKSATRAAQFLDRDTDLAFATRVGDFLQDFLEYPEQDLGAFLGEIQAAWTAP